MLGLLVSYTNYILGFLTDGGGGLFEAMRRERDPVPFNGSLRVWLNFSL